MMTMLKSAGLLVAMAALAAGCGGSGNDSPGAQPTGDDQNDKGVAYSQCMRKNGVPGFPDPVNGRLMLRASPGGPVDPQSPQFKAAQQACKALQPPGAGGDGPVDPQQQERLLKFVKCMRENGVPKFPDQPGPGVRISRGSGVDPDSPAFKAAMTKCQPMLAGGGPGGQ